MDGSGLLSAHGSLRAAVAAVQQAAVRSGSREAAARRKSWRRAQ
jgi:hypothetical protein